MHYTHKGSYQFKPMESFQNQTIRNESKLRADRIQKQQNRINPKHSCVLILAHKSPVQVRCNQNPNEKNKFPKTQLH
jgi:hypothetical protein